jgi:integrase
MFRRTRTRCQNGSLQKKTRCDGEAMWEFRWYEPSDSNGERRRRTMIVGPLSQYRSESAARKAPEVQALLSRVNSNQPKAESAVPTIAVLIGRFRQEELPERRHWTGATYAYLIRSFILPKWGETAVDAVDPIAVERWLDSLQTAPKPEGKTRPLAPKSKNHIKSLMHLLFQCALRWRWIQANPIDTVRVKGGSKRLKRPRVLSVEQFQAIVAKMKHPFQTMAVIAGCLGLRVGEISGLQWGDFNFEDSTVLISRSVVHGHVGDVKTEYSHEYMPLDGRLTEVLLEHKMRCRVTPEGWLFANPVTGKPYLSDQIQKKHIRPIARELAEVGDGVGWHTFRHSYRSWLDETGAPIKVQQELMRHANVQTTMNVYGKAADKGKRQANSNVVEMIMPSRKPLVGVNGSSRVKAESA